MKTFRQYLKEHDYTFDADPEAEGEERASAADDFFPKWDLDRKRYVRKSKDGSEFEYIPPEGAENEPHNVANLRGTGKWVQTEPAKLPLDGKRIVLTSYRQPPLVTPLWFPPDGKVYKLRGGLWYAEGDAWIAFSAQGYHYGLKMFVHEIFIDPRNVCIIDTKDKLLDFTYKYGIPRERFHDRRRADQWFDYEIDWKRVSQDYSGLECFGDGFQRDGWQYSWDIPSGVLWGKETLRDSRLLYVYNVKTKKYQSARSLGLYAGMASRTKQRLPEIETGKHIEHRKRRKEELEKKAAELEVDQK